MNDIITQMRQDKSSKGCWWGILFLALIGIIIFSLIIAVPFAAQKTWVDSMVADGNFESFSYRVFKSIRIVLLPSTIILIALVVYLLVLRRHSQSNILAP